MFQSKAEEDVSSRVPLTEDCDPSLPGSPEDLILRRTPRRRIPPLSLTFLVLISSVGTAILGFATGRAWSSNPAWMDKIIQFSPILKDIPLSYSITQFNGSLLKENIYRQPASPEVDAAWKALGVNYRALIVPSSLAQRSGLAADQVKINRKYGGGYPANVEGLHHLHCLNLLRQSLWYNYEYYHDLGDGAFKNDEHIVKFHVSHCLDIIRQQLMCTVDVGVLGQVWIHPEAPEAYVDFNTQHKCRNFDSIRRWAEERQMPAEVPEDWLEPPEQGDRVYEEIP